MTGPLQQEPIVMAIGSADNDIIDCTDIAEFYCWRAFPSRSCPTHTARSTWAATMSTIAFPAKRARRGVWRSAGNESTSRRTGTGSTNGAAVSTLATTLSWIAAIGRMVHPMAVAHEVLERGVGVGLDRNVKCNLRI